MLKGLQCCTSLPRSRVVIQQSRGESGFSFKVPFKATKWSDLWNWHFTNRALRTKINQNLLFNQRYSREWRDIHRAFELIPLSSSAQLPLHILCGGLMSAPGARGLSSQQRPGRAVLASLGCTVALVVISHLPLAVWHAGCQFVKQNYNSGGRWAVTVTWPWLCSGQNATLFSMTDCKHDEIT